MNILTTCAETVWDTEKPGKDSYNMYSFLPLWFTSSKALRWRQRSCTEWTGHALTAAITHGETEYCRHLWRRIKLRKVLNISNHKLPWVKIHQKRDRRQMDVISHYLEPASFPFPLMENWGSIAERGLCQIIIQSFFIQEWVLFLMLIFLTALPTAVTPIDM